MENRINIAERIRRLQERVEEAAFRVGKSPENIDIVAISKTLPPQMIIEAVNGGMKHIGENRVQEAEEKFLWLKENYPSIKFTRHLVGHLQSNKAGKAIQMFDLIHSVDSEKLGQVLSIKATQAGKMVNVLVQVNTSGEESQFGIEPEKALGLVEELAQMPGLKVQGLMTIGAFLPNPEDVRPCFVKLRNIRDAVTGRKIEGVKMKYLSMGMTNDFEIAIEEGANLIRIGTAIFGSRCDLL